MTRPTDPRGANRRGSGWGDDIGYSAERTTQTPAPRHVPQQTGPRLTPFVPQLVTFSDGTQAVIVPFTEYGVGRVDVGPRGTTRNMVIDVSPEFAPVTVEELEY